MDAVTRHPGLWAALILSLFCWAGGLAQADTSEAPSTARLAGH